MIFNTIFSGLSTKENVADAHREKPKTFQEELCYFIKPMIIIGAMPIRLSPSGWKVQLRSGLFLYSVIMYACILIMTFFSVSQLLRSFGSVKFEDKVFLQLMVMSMMPHFVVPFTLWPDSFSMAQYLNSWTEFQESYFDTTQTPLNFNVQKSVIGLMCFGILMCSQMVIVSRINPEHVSVLVSVTLFANLFSCVPLVFFWLISMMIVGKTGKILATRFKETLESGGMSFQAMRDYHRLWIRLNEQTASTGHVLFRSYIWALILQICFLVLSLYASVSFFVKTEYPLLAVYLGASLSTLGAMTVFCNHGYSAPIMVKSVQNELHKLSSLNTNAKVLQEARRFLETIKMNPSEISVGDYIVVNREMFSSICATLTTYLVVLLQFRMNET